MFKKKSKLYYMNLSIDKITVIESCIMGFVTYLCGSVLLNLFINKKSESRDEKKMSDRRVKMLLFMTGAALHIISKLSGIDQMIRDKNGIAGLLEISNIPSV